MGRYSVRIKTLKGKVAAVTIFRKLSQALGGGLHLGQRGEAAKASGPGPAGAVPAVSRALGQGLWDLGRLSPFSMTLLPYVTTL